MLRVLVYLGYIGIQFILVSLIIGLLIRNQRVFSHHMICSLIAAGINLHDLIRILSMTSPPIFFPVAQNVLSVAALLLAFKNAYLIMFWGSVILHLKKIRAHHYRYLRFR